MRPEPKQQLQYVLVPHPDDEFQAWSLIEGAAHNYPVFILLTHGEGTGLADGRALETGLSERVPQPQPFHGKGSLFVRAQRLDSWHAFLDAMAAIDPTLDVPRFHGHLTATSPPPPGPAGRSGGFDLFIGERTARVVLDLGDGSLDQAAVAWALRTVREQVRPLLPVQQELGVVGAAYYNASHPGPGYTHGDHRAVHLALWHVDFGLPGPQWCRTAHADPDVEGTGGRTSSVSPAGYAAAMGLGPDGTRTGRYQWAYGWLAFFPGGHFPVADGRADDGATSRYQSFWRRF